jgi:hypothetical protein
VVQYIDQNDPREYAVGKSQLMGVADDIYPWKRQNIDRENVGPNLFNRESGARARRICADHRVC